MNEDVGLSKEGIKAWIKGLPGVPGHALRFALRVVFRFFGKNNGLILAGAVAYNTLLSLIPLFAVILIFFSVFQDREELLRTIKVELELVVPGQAEDIGAVLADFSDQIEVIGIIGLLVLLFFSTIAFRIVENAMAAIFDMPADKEKRSFWVSALIPYLFICLMGLGIVLVTAATSLLDAYPSEEMTLPLMGLTLDIDATQSVAFYVSGVVGLVILFTAVYLVMPLQKVALRRALIGGLTATVLWEIVRHFLVWYFTQISLVNVVYGSLATVIIVLLSMEVAAVILLLGAQVIAELERAARTGVPWYQAAAGEEDEKPRRRRRKATRKADQTTVRTHKKKRDD